MNSRYRYHQVPTRRQSPGRRPPAPRRRLSARPKPARRAPVLPVRGGYVYRDRRKRRQRKLAGWVAVAVIVLILLGLGIRWLANRPEREPVVPIAPTQEATQAPAATATPAPTPIPGALVTPAPQGGGTPMSVPGVSGQPSLSVNSRQSLISLFWWMIDSGNSYVKLDSLGVSREEIADVADKFSNYFETCSYNKTSPSVSVAFKPGLNVLLAIQKGTVDSLEAQDQQIAHQAQEVVAGLIQPGMTDLEKELAIHDYIADHCEYLVAGDADNLHSVRGFFQNGLCRCAGYVDTFRLLGELAGLKVHMIGGSTTRDSSSIKGHAWSLVRLDGLWYVVDVTWDDMLGGASGPEHVFFNLPYPSFGSSRSWSADCCPPGEYAVNVDGNYYFYRSGFIAYTVEEAMVAATRQLATGRAAYIYFAGEDLSEALETALAEHYGGTVKRAELSEDLVLNVYKYTVK